MEADQYKGKGTTQRLGANAPAPATTTEASTAMVGAASASSQTKSYIAKQPPTAVCLKGRLHLRGLFSLIVLSYEHNLSIVRFPLASVCGDKATNCRAPSGLGV
jgi:hypothetical protein